jgi:hypothetical protein
VKSKENLKTVTKIDGAKIRARDDEVKAVEKTIEEFRPSKKKQIDKGVETKAVITLPHPSATISYILILTFTSFIWIFISILNSFVADPWDHHFQTFTIGDLSDCKLWHLSQSTASIQADTAVKTLANPDPHDLSKFLEIGLRHTTKADHRTLWFLATYSQAESGNLKPSFTLIHLYSTT